MGTDCIAATPLFGDCPSSEIACVALVLSSARTKVNRWWFHCFWDVQCSIGSLLSMGRCRSSRCVFREAANTAGS